MPLLYQYCIPRDVDDIIKKKYIFDMNVLVMSNRDVPEHYIVQCLIKLHFPDITFTNANMTIFVDEIFIKKYESLSLKHIILNVV